MRVDLEQYHRFVVGQLADAYDWEDAMVVEFMVASWISDHIPVVANAGASISNWKAPPGMDAGEEPNPEHSEPVSV